MLIELRIRNLAVIEELSLEFGPGLNVLSGETGAGKSIVVGALSLLLGERASTEVIRAGADRATVEATFALPGEGPLRHRLGEIGVEEGELLILRRELQREGRNRAWINGSAVPATLLGEVGQSLVDLHGQHEHQALLQPAEQRRLLDAMAGAVDLAEGVADQVRGLSLVRKELDRIQAQRQELQSRSDFLRFQLEEIQGAKLAPGEDEALAEELRRVEHGEELQRDAAGIYGLLYAEEGSASEQMAEARELLRRMARVDPGVALLQEQGERIYHELVELGRAAGSYAEGVELSPLRAEELRGRTDLLYRLKRKYGPTLDEVLANGERLAKELAELEGAEVEEGELRRRIAEGESKVREMAGELSARRRVAAEELADAVEALFPALGMPGGRFRVALEPLTEVEGGGAERVTFLVSLNAGFEPRPLARVASGGETSRVMLALKTVLAEADRTPTLVFDEIDSGIGGAVALAVADLLRDLSAHHQLFAVTHLAQLASRAEHHFRVEKGEGGDGVSRTQVLRLEGEDRIGEVARMLGGSELSETSRAHARELLSRGAVRGQNRG